MRRERRRALLERLGLRLGLLPRGDVHGVRQHPALRARSHRRGQSLHDGPRRRDVRGNPALPMRGDPHARAIRAGRSSGGWVCGPSRAGRAVPGSPREHGALHGVGSNLRIGQHADLRCLYRERRQAPHALSSGRGRRCGARRAALPCALRVSPRIVTGCPLSFPARAAIATSSPPSRRVSSAARRAWFRRERPSPSRRSRPSRSPRAIRSPRPRRPRAWRSPRRARRLAVRRPS